MKKNLVVAVMLVMLGAATSADDLRDYASDPGFVAAFRAGALSMAQRKSAALGVSPENAPVRVGGGDAGFANDLRRGEEIVHLHAFHHGIADENGVGEIIIPGGRVLRREGRRLAVRVRRVAFLFRRGRGRTARRREF